MFNDIAAYYDFLNHLFSLGIDKYWRKFTVRKIAQQHPQHILDIATGTGDLALAMHRKIKTADIKGVDISEKMLEIAKDKAKKAAAGRLTFQTASAASLPFPDDSFDALTIAFGIRNFEHFEAGLNEARRVLKPGGTLAILEFSTPTRFPVKQLYRFYFHAIVPLIGRFFSKHRSAYIYLPASVSGFPQRNEFLAYLQQASFRETSYYSLSLGIAMLYMAKK